MSGFGLGSTSIGRTVRQSSAKGEKKIEKNIVALRNESEVGIAREKKRMREGRKEM